MQQVLAQRAANLLARTCAFLFVDPEASGDIEIFACRRVAGSAV